MDSFKKNVPARKYRQLFADWIFDGKTRSTNSIPEGPRAHLGQIEVPFVVIEDMGALNLHRFGVHDLMENAGTPANRKWLIMAAPEYALPVHRWQLEALAFFDHVVHGADNGYAAQAPIRYHVDGRPDGEFRTANAFPIPGCEKVRFYFSSGGADAEKHLLTTSGPTLGKNSWGAIPFGAIVPPKLDEVANPILTFEAAIAEEMELSGPVTLSLSFSCTEIDSHVIARVGRVDGNGAYHLLSMGSLRPACRKIDVERSTQVEIAINIDTPEPLMPGKPVTLLFSLTPRPALFATGDRIRLDIGSRTDILRSDVAHGYEQFDMQVPPYFSRNTIHFDENSYLELERVPPGAVGGHS